MADVPMFILILTFLIFVTFYLYKTSHVARYHLKFLYFYFLVTTIAVIVTPLTLFRPCDVENYRMVRWLLLTSMELGIMLDLQYDKRNEENLVQDTACIVVCNHQSSIDLVGMMEIWPSHCTSLAKRELLFSGPFGPAAWLCGTIFIDRMKPGKARDTMSGMVEKIKRNKIKVWVYPEGTRNHDGNMLPFKKGAFHLAIQAQIPVLPVVFSSYDYFLKKQERVFLPGKVIITCLPPISTEGLQADDVADLTEQVRNQMVAVFKTTSEEMLAEVNAEESKKQL